MNAKRYVLDTSAILTLIEDESGPDRVQTILREGQVWLLWVVLLEATYITRQELGESEANLRDALLKELPVTIGWEVDGPLLLTVARLKATYRVSLADAIIATYTIRRGATLVHKDPEYESLSSDLDLEALPYKGRADTTECHQVFVSQEGITEPNGPTQSRVPPLLSCPSFHFLLFSPQTQKGSLVREILGDCQGSERPAGEQGACPQARVCPR